jgi:hypothetical protein
MKAIDRLRAIEKDYKSFIESEMDKIMARFMFPAGALIPTRIFPKLFEASRRISGLRTIFTSASGYNDGFYEFNGSPVISFIPVLGFMGYTPGNSYCSINILSTLLFLYAWDPYMRSL